MQISYKRLEKQEFDKSMFQRLVEGGFPYKLLMHQSRMRPEMVCLYAHQYKKHKEERGGQIQSNAEVLSFVIRKHAVSVIINNAIILYLILLLVYAF